MWEHRLPYGPFRSDVNVKSLSLEEVPRRDKKAEKRHARIALDKQAGTRILTIQFEHGLSVRLVSSMPG
jgi:hypothetical protein